MAMKTTGAVGVLLLLLLPSASTAVTNSTLVTTRLAYRPPAGCAAQIVAANQACVYLPAEDYVELHQHSENRGHQRHHNDDDSGSHHEVQHHRHHNDDDSGSHHEERRAFTDCCRWLKAVDEECVCQALRSLPPALFVRGGHSYKISIGNACDATYKCGGF